MTAAPPRCRRSSTPPTITPPTSSSATLRLSSRDIPPTSNSIVCALMALYWFHVPFRGSFLTLLISSAMFMVVVLSLGFFISVVAKNQLAASQIALLVTFLPAFLLSGFLYAIEQMPVTLQWITRILPARYYVALLKKVFLKGTPTALLYADLVPLAVFALVLALLATRAFHKRLA